MKSRAPLPASSHPVIRSGLCVFVLCSVAIIFVFQRARASMDDGFVQLGSRIVESPGHSSLVRRLKLNGIDVFAWTETQRAPLTDVIERYRMVCSGGGVQIGEHVFDLGLLATLSAQSDDVGYVACLSLGDDVVPLDDLLARFERFATSGGLHEVGQLRYVWARQVSNSPTETSVFTMWSGQRLNIYDLVPPQHGDAPGRDISGIPRPPRSRRLLSAEESGAPSAFAVYETSAGAHAIIEFYREKFGTDGWRRLEAEGQASAQLGQEVIAAELRGTTAVITVGPNEQGGTLVTVLKGDQP